MAGKPVSISVEHLDTDTNMLPSLGRFKNPPATGTSIGFSVSSTEARYAAYKRLNVGKINLPRGLPAQHVQNMITESRIQLHQPTTQRFGLTDPRYLPWEKLPRYSWRRTDDLRGSDPVLAPDRFYLQTYGGQNYTQTSIQQGLQTPGSLEEIWSEELNSSSRRRRLIKLPEDKGKPKTTPKRPQKKRRSTKSRAISAVESTETTVENKTLEPESTSGTPKPSSALRQQTASSVSRCSSNGRHSKYSREDSTVAEVEEQVEPPESATLSEKTVDEETSESRVEVMSDKITVNEENGDSPGVAARSNENDPQSPVEQYANDQLLEEECSTSNKDPLVSDTPRSKSNVGSETYCKEEDGNLEWTQEHQSEASGEASVTHKQDVTALDSVEAEVKLQNVPEPDAEQQPGVSEKEISGAVSPKSIKTPAPDVTDIQASDPADTDIQASDPADTDIQASDPADTDIQVADASHLEAVNVNAHSSEQEIIATEEEQVIYTGKETTGTVVDESAQDESVPTT